MMRRRSAGYRVGPGKGRVAVAVVRLDHGDHLVWVHAQMGLADAPIGCVRWMGWRRGGIAVP